nr:MAG TPA: hypothetical protein [Caudoviricetes sp.]
MDRQAHVLRKNSLSARSFLRRQTARITEIPVHVKGKMNGCLGSRF